MNSKKFGITENEVMNARNEVFETENEFIDLRNIIWYTRKFLGGDGPGQISERPEVCKAPCFITIDVTLQMLQMKGLVMNYYHSNPENLMSSESFHNTTQKPTGCLIYCVSISFIIFFVIVIACIKLFCLHR